MKGKKTAFIYCSRLLQGQSHNNKKHAHTNNSFCSFCWFL